VTNSSHKCADHPIINSKQAVMVESDWYSLNDNYRSCTYKHCNTLIIRCFSVMVHWSVNTC